MDEPTLAEEVRRLADEVRRLIGAQERYVTKEIMDLKLEALTKDHQDLEVSVAADRAAAKARLDTISRWLWSGVAAPVIVGIILYVLIGKTP